MSQTRMWSRPVLWAALSATALTAAADGWHGQEASDPADDPAAQDMTAAAEADVYSMSAQPDVNTGVEPELLAGGDSEAGVTVSYLKFRLDPRHADRALTLRLPLIEAPESALAEVSMAPSSWTETGLTAATAPALGQVLDTRVVSDGDDATEFDVSGAAAFDGVVSLAVTTSSADEVLRWHSRTSTAAVPSLVVSDAAAHPDAAAVTAPSPDGCGVGALLTPDCGSLLGVAPGAHVAGSKVDALRRFEAHTDTAQHVYHSYHRGFEAMFPTAEEIAVADDPRQPRALFVNWKPQEASWAEIAAGDPEVDAYLDELGAHMAENFDRPFFFTVHHEPEDDVQPDPGSGWTAADFAAMFRHVVHRLRDAGATAMVSVMSYMAYLPWTQEDWHADLYPGDDVVDWIAWDTYGYSDPGYGHGDFAELVNRVSSQADWPGFYNWAALNFPDKQLMIGEWGVWRSSDNPGHQAEVFAAAAEQMAHFPRLKAVLYFESENAEGRDSRVHLDSQTLAAYREFSHSRHFAVRLPASR